MKVAGLQKLSLVDYPGHLATAVFTQGCNFKCGYCQNPALVTYEESFNCSEKEALDFISSRRDKIDGVVITGGEPTCDKDLPGFIEKVRKLSLKIKLDTNGANPALLMELLKKGYINYLAVDIKTSLSKYDLVTNQKGIEKDISESIFLTILSIIPYEFRTTCVPGIVDEDDFKKIGELVKGAQKYCLQQFRPTVTLDKKFHDIKPYTPKEIKTFQKILEDYVKVVEVRGV